MKSTKRCDIGSKSEDPCRAVAVGFCEEGHHSGTPGAELNVCQDHAIDALGDGHTVSNDDGEELRVVDDEYVWSDA